MVNNLNHDCLIFVIGRNRSGTKWLSNILAENQEVSAIQREGAGGIIECNLLSTYPKNFNLKNIEEKTAFEILFRYDNFHKCSGLNGSAIDQIEYGDCYDFFEKYAKQVLSFKQTPFFLQKASSNLLPLLLKKFPNARYIVIQRKNVVENVISNMLLHTKKISYSKLMRLLMGYWRFRKLENKFTSKYKNIIKVSYEELKLNPDETLTNVCEFLNLNYSNEMLVAKYKPNTSFKKGINRDKYLTKQSKLFIYVSSFFIKLFPNFLFDLLFKLRLLSNEDQNLFIAKTFELHRNAKKDDNI